MSTQMSTSLSSHCSPLETEPNNRKERIPNWLRNSSAWADIKSMYSLAVLINISFHGAKIENISDTYKDLVKFFEAWAEYHSRDCLFCATDFGAQVPGPSAPTVVTLSILSGSFLLEHLAHAVHIVRWRDAKGEFEATDES